MFIIGDEAYGKEDYRKKFDDIRHESDGIEYWYARELMKLLDYVQWRNFDNAVNKAMFSCENNGNLIENHFSKINSTIAVGNGARREVEDYMLTRYACYLIAENGDPRKEQIAFAQSYFAVQTRKQELIEERISYIERTEARGKLRESEKRLSQNIYERGVDDAGFGRIRALRYYDEIGLLGVVDGMEFEDAPVSFEAFHVEDAEKVTGTIVSGRNIDDSAISEISGLIKSNMVDGKVGNELLQIYGSREKYLSAVEESEQHPEVTEKLQEELKNIYFSFRDSTGENNEMLELVKRLEDNTKKMYRTANARYILLKVAEEYLANGDRFKFCVNV